MGVLFDYRNTRAQLAADNGQKEMLEYTIVHELAHLRESNHTAAFWNFVANFDPEYREHAEWLSENGTELVFSANDI